MQAKNLRLVFSNDICAECREAASGDGSEEVNASKKLHLVFQLTLRAAERKKQLTKKLR